MFSLMGRSAAAATSWRDVYARPVVVLSSRGAALSGEFRDAVTPALRAFLFFFPRDPAEFCWLLTGASGGMGRFSMGARVDRRLRDGPAVICEVIEAERGEFSMGMVGWGVPRMIPVPSTR